MFKKTIVGALALISVLSFQIAQARPLEDIQKSGKIIIGTYGNFLPFTYFEGDKFTGFEVDIGNEIAKRLNLKAEWKPMEFDSLLTGLSQDRWDLVIASFGITEQRAKAVDFADPHYCTGGVIVSTKPDIKTAGDLNGKTVSVQTGSTYFLALQKVDGVKVRNLASDNARNALISGKADAWVTDKFAALMFQSKINADKSQTKKVYLGDLLFDERVATAVKKGNTELLNKYNQALADMMKDGTYEGISKKWFNEDVRCKVPKT